MRLYLSLMGNNSHTLIKTILNEKMSWDYESVKKAAEKYPNRNQFKINLPGAYEFAVKNGILDKILPISKNKWDYESVKKEAEKYPSYVEFQKNSPGAYNFAIKNKIINDFFPARKIWDVKSIEDESKKYKSRQEFKYGSPTAYVSAWRKGMLDTLFPQRLTTSVGERIVDEFLTKNGINFKREKTFEGCFVEKNNKCFKLKYDFYLPEKNTLIEYDGIGHYKPVDRFGGEEGFSTRRMYDFIKDKFAESQNMKLIRIPYTVRTIDEVGKYLNTITESDITRIVKRVLKEQNDSEGDSTECLKQYIDFLFEPTDFDKDGYPVDGGDLGLWNNNKIPNLNDEEAYNRFMKHLEYCHNDVGIYDDDACENITLEDMIPLAKNLYRNKITNTSNSEKNPDDKFYKLIIGLYSKNGQPVPINVRRRMSNSSVIDAINKTMVENPPNEFDDEFEYADNILNWTAEIYYPYLDEIDSMDEIIDFMKEEYSDIIFDNFYSQE